MRGEKGTLGGGGGGERPSDLIKALEWIDQGGAPSSVKSKFGRKWWSLKRFWATRQIGCGESWAIKSQSLSGWQLASERVKHLLFAERQMRRDITQYILCDALQYNFMVRYYTQVFLFCETCNFSSNTFEREIQFLPQYMYLIITLQIQILHSASVK